MLEMRLNYELRKKENIDQHIKELKYQIDSDTYRQAEARKK